VQVRHFLTSLRPLFIVYSCISSRTLCLARLPMRNDKREPLSLPPFPGNTFIDREENRDIVNGDWRPINLERAPFNLPRIIDERCLAGSGAFRDKRLGLWPCNVRPSSCRKWPWEGRYDLRCGHGRPARSPKAEGC